MNRIVETIGACTIFALVVYSCVYPPRPVDPISVTTCEDAKAHLVRHDCAELLTVPGPDEIPNTEDDLDWKIYCERVQSSGIISLDLDCVGEATSCDLIKDCL
jgi:hypothetical protein